MKTRPYDPLPIAYYQLPHFVNMPTVRLKKGREKSLLNRHPWVFSGAIDAISGDIESGQTVDLVSANGRWLATGAFSPQSQIAVRIWSFDQDEKISIAFFRNRISRAILARTLPGTRQNFSACRLIHSESDGLPGLTIDKYGDYLVCQFLSAGAEYWKTDLVRILEEFAPCKGSYERSDVAVREKEGLSPATGILSGDCPPEPILIEENNLRFRVDVLKGHKTGFYLDQRENRAMIPEFCKGADVLNCFAYTGAFGVAALAAGAKSVTNIESNPALLDMARENTQLNGLDFSRVQNLAEDAFHTLRRFRDSRRKFDVIILDPPKFAESRSQIPKACRGYKDINLLAAKLLSPGGTLITFSCSGLMPQDLFQKIVADAARDAGRTGQIVRRLYQASDHPTALEFPEGTYLKGLICRVW
jgi:23S rRNA (cytosine1962-C5)-methyltransferase